MRKLIMWNVMSLDGYFEGEKAWDLDFHQTVWGEALEKYVIEQLKTADMLVFGRNTYEGMAEYWQTEEGEVADHMNSIKKIACSTTLKDAAWNNTVVVSDALTELQKLKQEGDGNMLVFGSGNLSENLMRAGLFDEYRICIAPVFLGKGKHLFNEGVPNQKLRLLKEITLESGGVILMYAPSKS